MDLLEKFSEDLGFTYRYQRHRDLKWGTRVVSERPTTTTISPFPLPPFSLLVSCAHKPRCRCRAAKQQLCSCPLSLSVLFLSKFSNLALKYYADGVSVFVWWLSAAAAQQKESASAASRIYAVSCSVRLLVRTLAWSRSRSPRLSALVRIRFLWPSASLI